MCEDFGGMYERPNLYLDPVRNIIVKNRVCHYFEHSQSPKHRAIGHCKLNKMPVAGICHGNSRACDNFLPGEHLYRVWVSGDKCNLTWTRIE